MKLKKFNYKIMKNKFAKQPYHWICTAGNAEIRCHSENYSQKINCLKAVRVEIKHRIKGVCTFEDCTGETEGKIPESIKAILK
jgi:uncharacterized protein YegP (UPF0339 family)